MTTNNLKCEIDLHAEANSETNEKFNLLSVNSVSA